MRRVFQFVVIIVVALGFVGLVGFLYQRQWPSSITALPVVSTTGPITLGVIVPLSGDAAVVGLPISRAIDLAIAEINASGGVRGRLLQSNTVDGRCAAGAAVTAAVRLIDQEHVPVLLTGCSSETLAIAPLAQRAHTIVFSPSSTSPAISTAGNYIFRNAPSDASQGSLLAEAAAANHHQHMAVLYEETDYAVGITKAFSDRLGGWDGRVSTQSFSSNETDLTLKIAAVKAMKPDGLLIVVQSPGKVELVLRALAHEELFVPLFGNDVLLGAEQSLRAYPSLTEGLIGADLDVDVTAPAVQDFLRRYETKYGTPPLYPHYAALSYDAVQVIREAMQAVGTAPTDLRAYLSQRGNFRGITGDLLLDANGDPASGHVLRRFNRGVMTFWSPPTIDPLIVPPASIP